VALAGVSAQNAYQAAPSLRNWAKERIDFISSSRNPRRYSSPSRFSYKSLPKTSHKSRITKVIFAVNLFTAFGQVMFKVPQIRRLLDLVGHLLCLLNHFVKFLAQSSVEGFAGDGLF
jgi:hypothetical protein